MIIVKANYTDGTSVFKTFLDAEMAKARAMFTALRNDIQTTYVSIDWAR